MNSEKKCRGSIHAMEFAMLLIFIGFVLGVVAISEENTYIANNPIPSPSAGVSPAPLVLPNYVLYKFRASNIILLIAFVILFIACLNAAYYGCFRTAIMGTLLFALIF